MSATPTTTRLAPQTVREMLNEIDDRGEELTPWEVRFVADLIDRDPARFTGPQASIVERIWRERVSR